MEEKEVLEWIQRRIKGWPIDERDLWNSTRGLPEGWPDDFPSQIRLVDNLIRESNEASTRSAELQLIHESLQELARDLVWKMLYGKVELDKIPPNLIAWAFMIAGEMLQPPKKPVGAPANPGHMRNLKILSVVDYLGWELGYSKAKSCRLVAKVIDRDVETVKTALDNGEKASKTHPGVYIFNWLELMGEKLI